RTPIARRRAARGTDVGLVGPGNRDFDAERRRCAAPKGAVVMSDDHDEAALRRLAREISSEPTPDVDWALVERELFIKIAAEPSRPAARHEPRWRPIVVVAAAIAVAAGIFAVYRQ